MPRYKLTMEYDGTPYSGWQAQDNAKGVQNVLQHAIHGFCGETVTVAGAGRTDSGVHAAGQVAHIDLEKDWEEHRVREALNAHLRDEKIVILNAEKVDPSFDARFSAKKRVYHYRMLDRHAPPALARDHVWHVRDPLDALLMQEGANFLLGHHDFTTFRHARCQAKSPMKTLDVLDVTRKDNEILVVAESRSFLHAQVRSMVGSLKIVGEGAEPPCWMKKILQARDRTLCGAVAPPQGLTLMRVDY